MATLKHAVLGALLACLTQACDSKTSSSPDTPAQTQADESISKALPKTALQVAPAQLEQLEITQPGGEPVTLRIADGQWNITAPLSYPAKVPSVESMLAVLAEVEIVRRVAAQPEPPHRLGADARVLVTTWSNDGAEQTFAMGASTREETFVQLLGESQVYAVRGSCRRFFDLSAEQLREPSITSFDVASIKAVRFVNASGTLDLVPSPENNTEFVEATPSIANFNSQRASKNVAVLAALFAKGFVDPPIDAQATGLFNADTPRAEVSLQGKEEPLTVFIGARTANGRLHLRTSNSEQIYLVSAHLGSSLAPKREHFERTDAEVQPPLAADTDGPITTPAQHAKEHKHGTVRPTRVPPKLMGELRALAAQQR
tara:strand:+ start:78101 stop:79216 length:1116 start_codon:yes stop_codon:yes gene_type:complete